MSCFTAPLVQAIALSSVGDGNARQSSNPFARRLGSLKTMLYGGSALLAIEHVWHGEIIPTFPFLTAVKDGDTMGMLREIATVGVSMAVLVTAVWAIGVLVAEAFARRGREAATAEVR